LGNLSLTHSSHFLTLSSALSPWFDFGLKKISILATWLAKIKFSSSLTRIFFCGKGFHNGFPAWQLATIMP